MNLWRSQATTTRVKVSGSSAPAPAAPVKLTPWHRAPNTVTLVTARQRSFIVMTDSVCIWSGIARVTVQWRRWPVHWATVRYLYSHRDVSKPLYQSGLGIMFASFIPFLSPFLAGFDHFGLCQLWDHGEAHSSTRYACVFKHWTMARCCAASRARPPAASCISHVQIILAYIYKDSLLFIISELGSWD